MDLNQEVLKAFEDAGDAVRPGDIVEKTGADKKDVDKAIKQLKEEGKIYSPKRCFYEIVK
ncbi:MAG: MarR family transcriptional regulator [Acidaminobacter sp.]|uniref:MarR family transcriptional regulator n=1 Tax=Acidaminobacter sp. TaxID=1872102 RepID=UPI00138362A8|nr:MarR family transcriptional regulator [Acidaminobacter sp.]MZQ96728.1 MarR family transcriptional regulator [Acidaminobacter sp.]